MPTSFYSATGNPVTILTVGAPDGQLIQGTLDIQDDFPFVPADDFQEQAIKEIFPTFVSDVRWSDTIDPMAVVATQPSVGTSATLIAQNTAADVSEGDYRARAFLVKNIGGGDIFLGGDNTVTTGNGFKWSATDGILSVELEPGETLYGIAASAQQLHVIRTGR